MVLTEGRNRVVRRLWEAVGCQVNRLVRTRFGEIELPFDLKSGTWRYLSKSFVNQLVNSHKFQ
jgi:23S rRNA pseudouridine2605 synthase